VPQNGAGAGCGAGRDARPGPPVALGPNVRCNANRCYRADSGIMQMRMSDERLTRPALL